MDDEHQNPSKTQPFPESTLCLVETAVEKLKITEFLDQVPDIDRTLREKIRAAYERHRDDGASAAILIFADCMPLAASATQFSVETAEYDEALRWARETRVHAPPELLLSTLILIFLIRRYAEMASDEGEKQTWDKIAGLIRCGSSGQPPNPVGDRQ